MYIQFVEWESLMQLDHTLSAVEALVEALPATVGASRSFHAARALSCVVGGGLVP